MFHYTIDDMICYDVFVDGELAAVMEVADWLPDEEILDTAFSAAELCLDERPIVSYLHRPEENSIFINTGYSGWPQE